MHPVLLLWPGDHHSLKHANDVIDILQFVVQNNLKVDPVLFRLLALGLGDILSLNRPFERVPEFFQLVMGGRSEISDLSFFATG